MKKTVIILFALAFIASSCGQTAKKQAESKPVIAIAEELSDETEKKPTGCNEQNVVFPNNAYYLIENFVDSTQVGKKGHYKIELLRYVNEAIDDCLVRIFCYSRGKYNDVRKTYWWFCNDFIFDVPFKNYKPLKQ